MWNAIKQYLTTTKSIIFTHKWTIENYSHLYNEDHAWKWNIRSDVFSPPNNELIEFDFDFCPKDKKDPENDYVSIGVAVQNMPTLYNEKIDCKWSVSIVDENGEMCETDSVPKYQLFHGQGNIMSNYQKYSFLFSIPTKYLPNDQLTLYFMIHLEANERIFNAIPYNKLISSKSNCAANVCRVTHTFTIDNVACLFESNDDETLHFIQSDYFPAQTELSERFCLRLYPNGWREEKKDFVDIVVWNDNENNVTVNVKISILDVDGKECDVCTRERTGKYISNRERCFGLNRAFILDNSNRLVKDNKLRIYCEMSYMVDSVEGKETVNNTQMSDVFKSESCFNISHKAVHYVSHQWTIDKFSALCFNTQPNYSINSQIFEAPTDTRFAFHLRLHTNLHEDHSKKYLWLYLGNVSQDIKQVTVQYRISILGKDGKKSLESRVGQSTIDQFDKTSIPKIPKEFFQVPSVINEYTPNDKLTILCEIWILQERKNITIPSVQVQSTKDPVPASIHMSNVVIQGSIFQLNSSSNIEGNVDIQNSFTNENSKRL